jgi:hypothetical protein
VQPDFQGGIAFFPCQFIKSVNHLRRSSFQVAHELDRLERRFEAWPPRRNGAEFDVPSAVAEMFDQFLRVHLLILDLLGHEGLQPVKVDAPEVK